MRRNSLQFRRKADHARISWRCRGATGRTSCPVRETTTLASIVANGQRLGGPDVGLTIYRGEPFSRTHENEAFDRLAEALLAQWGDADESSALIGNFFCNGAEIDAMLVRPHAIVIIEFKDYSGAVHLSENGPWRAGDREVIGGSRANPGLQVRGYRFKVRDYLREGVFRDQPHNDFSHISCLVVFTQDAQIEEEQLPRNTRTWLKVCDLRSAPRRLAQIASASLELAPRDVDALVGALGVGSYGLPGHPPPAELEPAVVSQRAEQPLPAQLSVVLSGLIDAIQVEGPSIAMVTGMVGTGKHRLVQELTRELERRGVSYTVCQPGARLIKPTAADQISLYSMLYLRAGHVEGGKIVHALASNDDPPDQVYVVLNPHLVSDDLWEDNGRRFGSGRLLRDLLTFVGYPPLEGPQSVDLEGGIRPAPRKLVVIGDPYCLTRGKPEESFLCGAKLEALAGVVPEVFHLESLQDDAPANSSLMNAQRIAGCMKAGVFNRLSLEATDTSCTAAPADPAIRDPAVVDAFGRDPFGPKIVGYTNEFARDCNRWIREAVFGRTGDIQPGDIVHFHSRASARIQSAETDDCWVPADSFAEVSWVGVPETVRQELKGRKDPIVMVFRPIRVRMCGVGQPEMELLYSVDYADSVDSGDDLNRAVALRVRLERLMREGRGELQDRLDRAPTDEDRERLKAEWDEEWRRRFESDPYINAARLRFGYALTLHRAQTCSFDHAFIDMDTGQGQENETYFRWAYTVFALDVARRTLIHAPEISPLRHARWDAAQARVESRRPRAAFVYEKTAPVLEVGDGRSQALVNLQRHIENLLHARGARIDSVRSSDWQERYTVCGPSEETCELSVYYNKACDVTRLQVLSAEPRQFGDVVLAALHSTEVTFEDDFQRELCALVSDCVGTQGFDVVSVEHHRYQEVYLVEQAAGWVQLRIDYDGKGFARRIAPQLYSDEATLGRLHKAFGL